MKVRDCKRAHSGTCMNRGHINTIFGILVCMLSASFALAESSSLAKETVQTTEFSCETLLTMQDRVSCRISLDETAISKSRYLKYLPEDCRAMSIDGRDECVRTYAQSSHCWSEPIGGDREACLQRMLNLTQFAERKAICGNSVACKTRLRAEVELLIKFKLYELEKRVEEMYEKDLITKQQATAMILSLEQKKIDFDDATHNSDGYADRKIILANAKKEWVGFIQALRAQKIAEEEKS